MLRLQRCIGKRLEGTVSNYEEKFHGNLCRAFGLFDSFLPVFFQIIFYNERIIFKLFYCDNIYVYVCVYMYKHLVYIYVFFLTVQFSCINTFLLTLL